MSKLKDVSKRIRAYDQFFQELIFTFLFKDLLYIFLPLVVIIFTSLVFGQFEFTEFIASSDLAFATTVLNATILSGFIELKVKHQNSRSWRLFEGSKLYILLVVISTLVLAFIIINDIKSLNIEDKTLGIINVTLIGISIVSLFLNYFFLISQKYGIWRTTNGGTILRKTKESLHDSIIDTERIIHLIKNTDQGSLLKFPDDERELYSFRKHEVERIKTMIEQHKENVDTIEKELSRLYLKTDSQQTLK